MYETLCFTNTSRGMMNNHYYALLCHFMTLCATIHGSWGQQFVPLYDLCSVQKTDKPDGTTEPPFTNGVGISLSESSLEYRIHAAGYENIETFRETCMRKIFMAGDIVKILVLNNENVWTFQFPSIQSAREFYDRNEPRGTITDLPSFDVDVVEEETAIHQLEFYDFVLYMRPYGLPENDRKMFILKPSPRAGQTQPIYMMFLSQRFSIEKTDDQLRFTFLDAKDLSCTIRIYKSGEKNVERVYEAISRYAHSMYSADTGWVSNFRQDPLWLRCIRYIFPKSGRR